MGSQNQSGQLSMHTDISIYLLKTAEEQFILKGAHLASDLDFSLYL